MTDDSPPSLPTTPSSPNLGKEGYISPPTQEKMEEEKTEAGSNNTGSIQPQPPQKCSNIELPPSDPDKNRLDKKNIQAMNRTRSPQPRSALSATKPPQQASEKRQNPTPRKTEEPSIRKKIFPPKSPPSPLNEEPTANIGVFAFTLLCSTLFAILGFLPVQFPVVIPFFGDLTLLDQESLPTVVPYFFQIPVAIFLGGLLGTTFGSAAIGFSLLVGAFLVPLYGSGGGGELLYASGTGYLLGMLAGSFTMGKEIRTLFSSQHVSEWTLLKGMGSAWFCVLLAHALGTLWLIGQGLWLYQDGLWLQHAWLSLSWDPLPYDLFIAAALVGLIRPVRWLFWLVLY